MRLIDENGEQKGVMKTFDAMHLAEEAGLDLVEVSPNANPPVCKILDFGKNQTVIKVKEIRMQPKIDRHDLETKSKFISEFLGEGNKVKVSIRFRGRELAHPELGKEVLDRILAILTENGVQYNLDKGAFMEGKMMSMFVSPVRAQKK